MVTFYDHIVWFLFSSSKVWDRGRGRSSITNTYKAPSSIYVIILSNFISILFRMPFTFFLKQMDTMRVIFAYSDTDPSSEEAVMYHGSTRGTKSITLLAISSNAPPLPTDAFHYDYLNKNVSALFALKGLS